MERVLSIDFDNFLKILCFCVYVYQKDRCRQPKYGPALSQSPYLRYSQGGGRTGAYAVKFLHIAFFQTQNMIGTAGDQFRIMDDDQNCFTAVLL